ncbi:MAG: ABC transporter permease [Anaerolineae bacterium]|nr:ABC transporter permease [Anaerolineae bacterium]
MSVSQRALRWLRAAGRRLTQSPLVLFGTIVVTLFLLMAIFAPFVAPYNYATQFKDAIQQPPSLTHIMGTDNLGRDIFSRIVYGSRDVISLAGVGTIIAVIIGTTVGLAVTYRGGLVEELTMRLMDSMLAIPASLLALLLVGAVGISRESVILVLVVVYIPIVARVVRSVVLDVKTKGFVEAAKVRGESTSYILFREILPSVLPALVVEGSLRFAYAIFLVSTLGFLGVGVQPPSPDWGQLVFYARNYGVSAPWMLFYPCAAIALLVVSINLMADGLKQIFQASTVRE